MRRTHIHTHRDAQFIFRCVFCRSFVDFLANYVKTFVEVYQKILNTNRCQQWIVSSLQYYKNLCIFQLKKMRNSKCRFAEEERVFCFLFLPVFSMYMIRICIVIINHNLYVGMRCVLLYFYFIAPRSWKS